jgi:signal transduction histidine kinase
MYKLVTLFLFLSFAVSAQEKSIKRFAELDSIFDAELENNPDKVVAIVNEQKEIALSINNDSLLFKANYNKASSLNDLSIYDQSLEILFQLLKEAENKQDRINVAKVQYNISSIFFQMGDYQRCYTEFNKAKQFSIEAKQFKDTASINSEIALCQVALGKVKEGIALQEKCIALLKTYTDDEDLVKAIDNLSNSYYEIEDYRTSLNYQLQLLKYPSVFESLYRKTGVHQHLAELYFFVGNYDSAQYFVTKAIQYGKELKSDFWLFDCYKNQSAIYEAKGNFKEALAYHKLYLAGKDSVFQKDYASKMSAVANLYELEKKQSKISNLSKDKKLATAKIQGLSLGLLVLFLASVVAGLYFVYRKNKQDKLLKERFAQQLLATQEEERQRIAKDLHDSVGQNILFIKNQLLSKEKDDDKLLKSIDTAIEEVRNISKDLYPNQLQKYGLASAVDALSEQVKDSTGIFISSDLQGIDEALNKNVQINFYRIIQEFVNNTVKHADATAIRITTEQSAKELKLIVQDNGKGFDVAQLKTKANTSFGMLNMEERIKMLKGKVEIESEIGKGTKSVFTIPI